MSMVEEGGVPKYSSRFSFAVIDWSSAASFSRGGIRIPDLLFWVMDPDNAVAVKQFTRLAWNPTGYEARIWHRRRRLEC